MVLALFAVAFFTAPLQQLSRAADTTSTVTLRIDIHGTTREVVIELDETNAPKTSANFKKLASQGFYHGIAFHRVIPNYIVQAGDPLTKDASQRHLWGTGGAGYTIPAEIGMPHERGSIAMARLGDSVNPNKASSGSQFYIALVKLPKLDRKYTVFGKVISGLEYLDQIAASPTDSNNNPGERVEIVAASVAGGVAPSVAATAAMPKADKSKSLEKDSSTTQASAVPEPKKKSWLKRKFTKQPSEEVAEIEQSMPVTKKSSKPTTEVASNDDLEKPKKQSWFKRKFRKKQQAAELEVTEEVELSSMPASKPPSPKPPSPKPAPKASEPATAAAIASNDNLADGNAEPSYRNQDSGSARSAMPAQATATDNNSGSLADQMKTRASQGEDDSDVEVGSDKERGFVGRFLYRYW
ncbi:MAG: peptidylprolyl isomerase [Verrucomicrobia bacterium]|nr:peptidylprolyl isomerase [Verrucomicrobiota bacterium]